MSGWIESARILIGVSKPGPAAKKPSAALARVKADKTPDEVRNARLEQAQKMQLGAMLDEMEEIEAGIAESQPGPGLKRLIQEKRELHARIETHKGKLANTRAVRQMTAAGAANLEQADLIRAGADELESINAAMDELKVEDSIDRIQDAAAEHKDRDDVMSQPLFSSTMTAIDPDEIDAEMAAIVQERQEREARAVLFPPAPAGRAETSAPEVVPEARPMATAASVSK